MSAQPKVIKVEKTKTVNRNISHRYVISQREDKDDFYAFDLLRHKGQDLRDLPLVERKLRLKRLITKLDGVLR